MNVNAIPEPPRTNADGDPCPWWCDANHGHGVIEHHGARTEAEVRREGTLPTTARVSAHLPVRPGSGANVNISSFRYEADPDAYLGNAQFAGFLSISPRDAADLAGLIDALADLPSLDLRRLAGGIRSAAAAIRQEVAR